MERQVQPAAPIDGTGYFKCFRQVATAFNNFGIFVLSNGKLNSASWRRSDIEVALLNKLSTGSYRTGTIIAFFFSVA